MTPALVAYALVILAVVLAAGCVAILLRLRNRNVMLWLPSYLRGDWPGKGDRSPAAHDGPTHIMFAIADHFEPAVGNPGIEVERRRVRQWVRGYPECFASFRDADGRPPQHTFFFPAEEYRCEHLDRLAEPAAAGYCEVEIQLHHDNDTAANTRKALLRFTEQLRGHGFLGSDRAQGERVFAFVHGNWALDNSRPDGRWCGVNDELRLLSACGCYADFTLPSAPSATQTRRINSIYYAADDPDKPKSHDDGEPVRVGGSATGDLMIVQGPLSVRMFGGRLGILPRLENGNLTRATGITPSRIAAWVNTHVTVAGRPEWVFVKLYTHGCDPRNQDFLLGRPMLFLHEHLNMRYNDGTQYKLHYVTAREMYNIIKAAERGLTGDPGTYRDLEITPPPILGPARTKPKSSLEAIP